MKFRLWYAQLDVFDTARRVCLLLHGFECPPGIERLCIVDFFLANPPLLHRTNMTIDVRKQFNAFKIPRPEKTFITYPEAPLLFHKMEPIQREAVNALSGRGIISLKKLNQGYVQLTPDGKEIFPIQNMCNKQEEELSRFLTLRFASKVEEGNLDLRRRTGLRR